MRISQINSISTVKDQKWRVQEDLDVSGTAFFAPLSLWRRMGDAGQGLTSPGPSLISFISSGRASRWRVGTSGASTESWLGVAAGNHILVLGGAVGFIFFCLQVKPLTAFSRDSPFSCLDLYKGEKRRVCLVPSTVYSNFTPRKFCLDWVIECSDPDYMSRDGFVSVFMETGIFLPAPSSESGLGRAWMELPSLDKLE